MLGVIGSLNLTLAFKKYLEPVCFLAIRDGINHHQRRGIGPRRILEAEDAIVLDGGKKVHGLDEVVGRLSGESDDDVGGERDWPPGGFDPGDAFQVPVAGVLAGHGLQNTGRSGLDGQMDMVAEGREGVDGLDNVAGEVARVAGGEADAANPRHLPYGRQEFGEAELAFRVAVAVHVLAEELDLGVAGIGDATRFGQHRSGGPAALLAARIGHHAVGAELVAALDDGDVAAIGVLPGGKFGFESLVGLAVVESGDTVLAGLKSGQHLRKFPVGSRARYQRNVRRALEDLLALLLRHAPQHSETFAGLVESLVIVQAIEDLLLRFVADGAGVVENETGVLLRLDLAIALTLECANDLFGVMGVHLAPEGLKVEGFLGCHNTCEYTSLEFTGMGKACAGEGGRWQRTLDVTAGAREQKTR